MALQRSIASAARCHSCDQWLLRTFMAGLGISTPPRSSASWMQRRRLTQSARPQIRQRRPSWRAPKALVDADLPLNDINAEYQGRRRPALEDAEEEIEIDDGRRPVSPVQGEALGKEATTRADESLKQGARTEAEVLVEDETLENKPPAQDHLPWYLQVQQPIPEQTENPLAARQRIPDLPDHPPPLLQPLLEHVSVELGMDDLAILDLRSLDPPPALGANLLMIIGTARSEKHLHVSADRLCRWLRSTYKLRPYADGLLGRNELKLKMRRKAKRSRLLGAVGSKATADSEIDDGIRTGWVCVNIGRVEGGELPDSEVDVQKQGTVVGFGTQSRGSNIVVQMMTEEKRGEIDLETLWTQELERARKRAEPSKSGVSDSEAPASDETVAVTPSEQASSTHQSAVHLPTTIYPSHGEPAELRT